MQNLHTHTTYCDGSLPAEEMIDAALDKGCDSLGFSEHSYVAFDRKYSMSRAVAGEYIREINALRDKYEGVIEIFLGIERDYFTQPPLYDAPAADASLPGESGGQVRSGSPDQERGDVFDYIIGSVHHVKMGDRFVTVDAGAKNQKQMALEHFGGDYYAMAEAYFETIADVVTKTGADIIGHFDLVAKYNFGGSLFDETHPRYVAAALGAMDEILKNHKLFEVNTGAMYRFGKPEPYPCTLLLKELCARGGEVILSSDSHDAASICYKFGEMKELLAACGYRYIKRLTKNGFVDEKI